MDIQQEHLLELEAIYYRDREAYWEQGDYARYSEARSCLLEVRREMRELGMTPVNN